VTSPARPAVPQSAGLRRDLEVLRQLASDECLLRGGLGVVRIAVRLGREKSQVSRALHALEGEGLVERDPRTRTYRLGSGLYTLAARGAETRLVRAAYGHLSRLADEQRADVRLCVLIGGRVLTLISMPWDVAVEPEAPTHTPCGPVLALDWPEAALRDLVPEGGTEHENLLAGCVEARARGYLRRPGYDAGQARYAAPVRDLRGIVLAAIQLTQRPGEESATETAPGEAVVAAALALSGELGFEGRTWSQS
jgi:DNA-binding IclR family transcriptional regulator